MKKAKKQKLYIKSIEPQQHTYNSILSKYNNMWSFSLLSWKIQLNDESSYQFL